ncbi:MAG: PIN domain-containing protein [Methylococcaceae bacterium]|nr:MAG: PIN domain-containing protein [Methylococcaceae bacterium]
MWTIDASVAVKWFCPDKPDEAEIDKALLLLDLAMAGDVHFLQPPHWIAEVAGVLVRYHPVTADSNVQDMLLFDFCETIDHASVYRRAITLAKTIDHHLFDTLYHAVALEAGATFVTADARYYAKAAGLGGMALLANIAPHNGIPM